ncbi:magnesium and cobalt exporter, CNNM family [Cytobacillus horneckiae]|uniref:HlyC/CorC family transporter n=1 Tax=Cytobacillus horneckiae TaxID=549687 RepID=A0A2N0ZHN6_9BACI|nr:hemolysin family protein [Cytobacillus horneckiae]MBN6887690.1 HlyC/CorC family transporter [Cytobacillus horneckiae]MCM3178747.1 hemolysin family protein [Cytobacillus horneckiae]MEC1158223.1 hemolysin family protein [Cytobacillus horneckiae]MED2940133.1 hemolysin family protein [Cytobacillus horneckiae]PKG29018.1 HlyC/CorC family transporter [Cytobacillus horneckiae]
MDIFNLVIVAILIALTAFFVVSEFAIVKIRSSRIDQLIEEGSTRAVAVKKLTTHLDEYLSACQLGITITALALGWLGEKTFESILSPIFQFFNIPESLSHVLVIAFAFLIVTFLHVVVGELAPKTVAIHKAEAVTLIVAKPLIWFYRLMFPFIWVLNGSARLLTSLFGLKPASAHDLAHSEEELRIILSESYESGEINQSEFKYVNKIFDFDDRIAKEIMVPRTEIVSLSKEDSLESFLHIAKNEKFTRYPIIDGDKDHIIGLINIKEILTELISDKKEAPTKKLESYMRPIIRVIDSIPIHDLLLKMQKERIHMAILMDEYGGTSGLVTVEDIIEEIVGDIRDEFDVDEVPSVQKVKEKHYIFDAKVLVSQINDLLEIDINDEDVDTIGGWILTEDYEAKEGDILEHASYRFKILEMEDHHIKSVEVTHIPEIEETAPQKIPLTESQVQI